MHYRDFSVSTLGIAGLIGLVAFTGSACSAEDVAPQNTSTTAGSGGVAGSTAGTGGSNAGASTAGAGAATAGTGGGGAGQGGSTAGNSSGGTFTQGGALPGNTAGGGAGGTAGASGSAGASGGGTGGASGGTGGGKAPMCLTNDVQGGVDRADKNYIECDVEEQAIDFDIAANYKQPRKPGYDPAMTPVTFTDFGTALTGSAVQECHPYCYRSNLTIGLDLIAGAESSLRGEVLFGFPSTVAPIMNPKGRASLGWVYVDGPALPAGTTLTLTMVLKSTDKGIVTGSGPKTMALKQWAEFRYFPIDSGFMAADLVNITHIGFRVALTPTTMAQDWHGVIYADHFQLRK